MIRAIVPHAPCEFEANLTPSEMSEYNDYLDSVKVGTRDPLPEDFEPSEDYWHIQLGMEKLPPFKADATEIKRILLDIPIECQTVINEVLVKRTDRHTYNAQRKWKVYDETLKRDVYQYGNWALQHYSAKEVSDYILDVPKVLFTIGEVSK
jgi:hypothetical protein